MVLSQLRLWYSPSMGGMFTVTPFGGGPATWAGAAGMSGLAAMGGVPGGSPASGNRSGRRCLRTPAGPLGGRPGPSAHHYQEDVGLASRHQVGPRIGGPPGDDHGVAEPSGDQPPHGLAPGPGEGVSGGGRDHPDQVVVRQAPALMVAPQTGDLDLPEEVLGPGGAP